MIRQIILFDLDGTLIDSRADLATGINLTRKDYGLAPLPFDTVVSIIGDGIRNMMMRAFRDATCPWNIEEVIAADKRHYENHLLDETRLYPGVTETLPLLHKTHKLGVVTNKPESFVRKILDGLGILSYFDVIVGGGRCQNLKPHPEPLLLALTEAACDKDGSWMVGDHRTDLGAAVAAGLHGCFCAYGFGLRDNQPADAVIDSFTELPSIINH